MRITLTNDTLRMQDGRTLTATSDSSARMGSGGAALVFHAAAGAVTSAEQAPRGTRALVFRREAPFTPDRAALASLAGTYESEELDVRYVLAVTDSGLVLRQRKLGEHKLEPTASDAFAIDYGIFLQFTRDRSRKVTGFTLSDGRMRGVRFERVK
jgi:hypothetical protein